MHPASKALTVIALVACGFFLLLRSLKPAMKYEPAGVDEEGRTEYALVPCDEDESRLLTQKRVYRGTGVFLLFVGYVMSLSLLHDIAEAAERHGRKDAASDVYVREGGRHFHTENCPYLRDIHILSREEILARKHPPCPACKPDRSGIPDKAFLRKGGSHFHRETCHFLAKVRTVSRSEAVAARLKPCRRCGA